MKPVKQKTDCSLDLQHPIKERILSAAYLAFTEKGYARASTLEIATRAKVSKRELYAHFDNKQGMLVACITSRMRRMQLPPELPIAYDRESLALLLSSFGRIMLREICQPEVLAVFRLAIAEAKHSPEVAQALNSHGREVNRAVLLNIMTQAQASGLLKAGDVSELASLFHALLWRDLLINLLLETAEAPGADEIEARANKAASAFLNLNPEMNT
jgi:AcrR family transcriptional regulator